MKRSEDATILISPYRHVAEILNQKAVTHVVSILGKTDNLEWPSVGSREVLRLEFDDTAYSDKTRVAPSRDQIAELIAFARRWNGSGTMLIHCRAGSSRSPAAGMIAAAALGRPDSSTMAMRVRIAKAYFRPSETMLKLADGVLGPSSGLVDLARSVPVPSRTDEWAPVRIPLSTIAD